MYARHRITKPRGNLRYLVAGVGRIIAAVIKEITDVVRAEHLDQAFKLHTIFIKALELVAAGSKGAARRVLERGNGRGGLPGGVDQVFGEHAQNAVAAGKYLAYRGLATLPGFCKAARGFNHAGGRRVNDRCHPARLGVKAVTRSLRHVPNRALGNGKRSHARPRCATRVPRPRAGAAPSAAGRVCASHHRLPLHRPARR